MMKVKCAHTIPFLVISFIYKVSFWFSMLIELLHAVYSSEKMHIQLIFCEFSTSLSCHDIHKFSYEGTVHYRCL